jgi:acyl dehydratase
MIVWFDDLIVGTRYKGAEVKVTRDDIKRFAAEFDPQPFHLDEVGAEKTIFRGLAASGWHTVALAMRMIVSLHPFGSNPVVGLGVDDLRWPAPVRPDDTLHIEVTDEQMRAAAAALADEARENYGGVDVISVGLANALRAAVLRHDHYSRAQRTGLCRP